MSQGPLRRAEDRPKRGRTPRASTLARASFAALAVLALALVLLSFIAPARTGHAARLRADFDAAWGTANYSGTATGPFANAVHRERISIVDDPAGLSRKVARFAVEDADVGPTQNPRAQLELPRFINGGDEVWQGLSMFLPSSFPTQVGGGGTKEPFITHTSFGAPPFSGTAAVSYGSYGGPYRFGARLFGSGTYAWSVAPQRGEWQDYVLRTKLGAQGFIEAWFNDGGGLVRQKMENSGPGGTFGTVSADGYRWIGQTFSSGAQYPADSRLALYYTRGMYAGTNNPLTMYYGPAKWRVRRSGDTDAALLDSVDPHSHG